MRKKIWIFAMAWIPAMAMDTHQWIDTIESTLKEQKPDAFSQYESLEVKDKAAFLQDFLRYQHYINDPSKSSLTETDLIKGVLEKYDPDKILIG